MTTTTNIAEQVEAEFACDHAHIHMRRRLVANNVTHVYRQCVDCGKSFGAVGSRDLLPGMVAAMAPFDEELRERRSAERAARWQELAAQSRGQRSAEWWAAYHAYLDTPAWQERRTQVMQRCRRICHELPAKAGSLSLLRARRRQRSECTAA